MKKHLFIFLVFLCPIIVFSQNVEVEGGFIADSIDVQSGLIKNVADPISAQDAATKAYVDLLESKVDLLLSFLIDNELLTVQQRLDLGETPMQIFDSGIVIDSLYGKTYGGGLIFYLDTLDVHPSFEGLISDAVEQITWANVQWGCYGYYLGANNGGLGGGQINTTVIVNGCAESGIPARLCDDFESGGYDDWYLPNLSELKQMYFNIGGSAPAPNTNIGDFGIGGYWSSDEVNAFNAAQVSVYGGSDSPHPKSTLFNVRAVRAF